MKRVLIASATAAVLSILACSSAPDNVGACKKFASALKCGTTDLSASYNCDSYKQTSCDIAKYFDCLTGHLVCTNGAFDTAKLGTISECANLVTCK